MVSYSFLVKYSSVTQTINIILDCRNNNTLCEESDSRSENILFQLRLSLLMASSDDESAWWKYLFECLFNNIFDKKSVYMTRLGEASCHSSMAMGYQLMMFIHITARVSRHGGIFFLKILFQPFFLHL